MPFTGVKSYFNRVLLAAIEDTSGTAETLTAADVVFCDDFTIVPQPNIVQRRELGVGIDQGVPIVTSLPGQLNATVALRGSGSAGVAPGFGKLLQASRMDEVIVATTSVTYTPFSDPAETLTVGGYEDGKLTTMVGLATGWTITLSTTETPTITFTGIGTFPDEAEEDDTNPTITPPTVQPVAWVGDRGGVITLGGDAVIVSSLSFDAGVTPAAVQDANSDGGIYAHLISDRNITGSMNPATASIATRDFFTNLRDGDQLALVAVLGETAGNIMTINADVVITGKTPTNDGGVQRDDLAFSVVAGSFAMIWT